MFKLRSIVFLIFLIISVNAYCQVTNNIMKNEHIALKPEETKRILIDSLNKHKLSDSCEIFIENGALQIGRFMNNVKVYALIVIEEHEFLLFENKTSKWNLICDSTFENYYHGYRLKDINGDGCLDLLLPEVYIFDNISYKVLQYDCKTETFKYNPAFDGIFNPEYDIKTGLIDSYLMTNHGECEKETYKFTSNGLELTERVTLNGAGNEDRNKKKYVIKHYVHSGSKLIPLKTIRTVNYNNAIKQFDSLLFDTSINQNQFRPKVEK